MILPINAADPFVPDGTAKQFVTDIEWHKLVFALIPEAAAIIFVLPYERLELSSGVMLEITAIRRLGQERRTAVVLVDPELDPPSELGIPAIMPVDPGELKNLLHGIGFPHVFTRTEFLERGPALLAHISSS